MLHGSNTRITRSSASRRLVVGLFSALLVVFPLALSSPILVRAASASIWTVVPSPNPSTTPISNDAFFAVSALADNNVWAVGDFSRTSGTDINHTLTEHWNGTAWSVVPSTTPTSSELRGVVVTGTSDLWTAGSFDSLIKGNPGIRTLTAHTPQG